jgi:hypothetical protein
LVANYNPIQGSSQSLRCKMNRSATVYTFGEQAAFKYLVAAAVIPAKAGTTVTELNPGGRGAACRYR